MRSSAVIALATVGVASAYQLPTNLRNIYNARRVSFLYMTYFSSALLSIANTNLNIVWYLLKEVV